MLAAYLQCCARAQGMIKERSEYTSMVGRAILNKKVGITRLKALSSLLSFPKDE